MMELDTEQCTAVSFIDSLLLAIDLEERAFMESEDSMTQSNQPSKVDLGADMHKEERQVNGGEAEQDKEDKKDTGENNTVDFEKKGEDLQVESSSNILPPSLPSPDNVQVSFVMRIDDDLPQPATIIDAPLQHTNQLPDSLDTESTSSILTESTEPTEEDQMQQEEDDTESDGNERVEENQEVEQSTNNMEDIMVNIGVPEDGQPEDTSSTSPVVAGDTIGTVGDGNEGIHKKDLGWKKYKKSFLISVGSSEEEEGQAAVYKSKKGKGLRDIRQSINFSNNNMHIKSNNRALHGTVQKLLEERAALKEQLGWTYPLQYRHYSMYEEVINRDKTLGEPPKGVPIHTFLLEERQSILHDIFFLNSLLEIMEENKSFRSQITTLEKQVETVFAEVKVLESAKDMLQKSKSRQLEGVHQS